MESVFLNGGMIGVTLDYGTTDSYVIGTTSGPADITLVGFTTSIGTSITLPTGLQQNDLVVICTAADSDTAPLPTGYTNGQTGTTNSVGYRWSYKFMGVTPDTTASGLISTAAHIAFAFRGVNTTTPLDVTPPAIATNTAGMPDPPTIQTVTNKAAIVAVGFLDDDLVAASTTAPSTYTLIGANQINDEDLSTVMAAFKILTTAGTDNPGAFGGGGTDSWVAATFALRPATVSIPILGNLKNSGVWLTQANYDKLLNDLLTGQAEYTTPGTYSWTAPSGVTSVCVVCVGGGGGGRSATSFAGGGGGGALAWRNNIAVTPGTSYTVVVGAGGANTGTPTAGGNSFFISNTQVFAQGGHPGNSSNVTGRGDANRAQFVGGGGGRGGLGGCYNQGGGGGGAGGYSGDGGHGAGWEGTTTAVAIAGAGGGGGGGGRDNDDAHGSGGGVGILGAGSNGSAGASGATATSGGGGSGGGSGVTSPAGRGGLYGGGGGGMENGGVSSPGANGAVRIIWGPNRAFPSTNTGNL